MHQCQQSLHKWTRLLCLIAITNVVRKVQKQHFCKNAQLVTKSDTDTAKHNTDRPHTLLTFARCPNLNLNAIMPVTVPIYSIRSHKLAIKQTNSATSTYSHPSTDRKKYRTFCRTSWRKKTGHFTGLRKPISVHLLGIIVFWQYSISSDAGGQQQ